MCYVVYPAYRYAGGSIGNMIFMPCEIQLIVLYSGEDVVVPTSHSHTRILHLYFLRHGV